MGQVVGLDHHLDWKLEHIIISYAMYFQSLSNTKVSSLSTDASGKGFMRQESTWMNLFKEYPARKDLVLYLSYVVL